MAERVRLQNLRNTHFSLCLLSRVSLFFFQIIPMMHMLHFDRVQVTVVVVSIVEECHRRLTRRLPFQAVAPQLGVVV